MRCQAINRCQHTIAKDFSSDPPSSLQGKTSIKNASTLRDRREVEPETPEIEIQGSEGKTPQAGTQRINQHQLPAAHLPEHEDALQLRHREAVPGDKTRGEGGLLRDYGTLKQHYFGYISEGKLIELWHPEEEPNPFHWTIIRALSHYFIREQAICSIMTSTRLPSSYKPVSVGVRRKLLAMLSRRTIH